MPVVLKNNARTVTRQDLTAVASTIVVADGSVFPTLSTGEYFYLTLIRSDTATEVVKVLAVVDTSLTVTRAQEGTAAREFPAGSFVEARVTAASVLEAASDAVDALTLGDLGITATATELNILDGATLSTAELNILDGVTTTAVGINSTVSNATQTRDTVALLLADTTLTYTAGQVGTVTSGSYVRTRAEGFSYRVAASGATDHHVATAGGVKLYVVPSEGNANVKAFGAVGDGATDDSVAMTACANYCATNGVAMYVPAGTYIVTYNAINPTMTSGKNFTIFGDGPTSVLKGKDGVFTADFRHIIRLVPDANVDRVEVRDLFIDNNARGSTPPASPFDYQRSAAILMAANPGFTQRSFSISNVMVKDPVADSVFVAHNSTSTLEFCDIRNIVEIDRTRVRHTVTVTRLPINTVISNIEGYSIQVEPNSVPTAKVYMNISNCVLDQTFTVDLDSEATAFPGELVVNNVIAKTSFGLAGAIATVTNCVGKIPTDGRACSNLLHGSQISNCRFLLPYNSGAGSITAFNPHYTAETVRGSIGFDNCDFMIDSTDDTITPTGYCIYSESISSSATAWKRNYRLSDCRLDPRAEYGIYLYRNGYWRLDNLVYGGRVAAIQVSSASSRVIDAEINGGDFSQVSGVIIRGAFFAVNQTTDIVQIRMGGAWQGVSTALFSTSSGNIVNANYFLFNTREIVLSALPSSATAGDIIVLTANTLGAGKKYVCTVSSVTAPTFRLLSQFGVKRDTTANRPAPTASDVGLLYLDNTLDADGKPIWWNGTAWVDATGATV
jgi:hypothetical protein